MTSAWKSSMLITASTVDVRSGKIRYGADDPRRPCQIGPKKIKSVVAMTEVMATTPLTRCGWRRRVDSAPVRLPV